MMGQGRSGGKCHIFPIISEMSDKELIKVSLCLECMLLKYFDFIQSSRLVDIDFHPSTFLGCDQISDNIIIDHISSFCLKLCLFRNSNHAIRQTVLT